MDRFYVFLILRDERHLLGTYDELSDEITEKLQQFVGALRIKNRFATPPQTNDSTIWHLEMFHRYARNTIMSELGELASSYGWQLEWYEISTPHEVLD